MALPICSFTTPPAEKPGPPLEHTCCAACAARYAPTARIKCNANRIHGCIACASWGLVCVVEGEWALPPHPNRKRISRIPIPSVISKCGSCDKVATCDRGTPCYNCQQQGQACAPIPRRGAFQQPLPSADMYGYWLAFGRTPENPMSSAGWAPWKMPENYHVEYAFLEYQKHGLPWAGPATIHRNTPGMAPQGAIWIGDIPQNNGQGGVANPPQPQVANPPEPQVADNVQEDAYPLLPLVTLGTPIHSPESEGEQIQEPGPPPDIILEYLGEPAEVAAPALEQGPDFPPMGVLLEYGEEDLFEALPGPYNPGAEAEPVIDPNLLAPMPPNNHQDFTQDVEALFREPFFTQLPEDERERIRQDFSLPTVEYVVSHETVGDWILLEDFNVIRDLINPSDETYHVCAKSIERPISPPPFQIIHVTPNQPIPNDHPTKSKEGAEPLSHIPTNRIWAPDGLVRTRGTCKCGRETYGTCESTQHHPAHRHYVCSACDMSARAAVRAFLLTKHIIESFRAYFCSQCSANVSSSPQSLERSSYRVFDASLGQLRDLQALPYDPSVTSPPDLEGNDRAITRGGLYNTLPLTGCACAFKLLGRRLCRSHRLIGLLQVMERINAMMVYAVAKSYETVQVKMCASCTTNPAITLAEAANPVGWICRACNGLVHSVPGHLDPESAFGESTITPFLDELPVNPNLDPSLGDH